VFSRNVFDDKLSKILLIRYPPSLLQWFRENETKADVDTHTFKDHTALPLPPISTVEHIIFLGLAGVLTSGTLLVVVAFTALTASVSVAAGLTFVAVALSCQRLGRSSSYLRFGYLSELACRFYGYRVVIEKRIDTSRPTIYALGGEYKLCSKQIAIIYSVLLQFIEYPNFRSLWTPSRRPPSAVTRQRVHPRRQFLPAAAPVTLPRAGSRCRTQGVRFPG
jgi:hypothetical protein